MTWPLLFKKQDVVGIAATGSGKTMAFGVPALIHLMNAKNSGIGALVLSPTRELAMQIHECLTEFGEPCGIKSVCIYGGVPKHEQKALLKAGVDIIIATPGRLLDLMQDNMSSLDLSTVKYLVLDEADRMLDFGV